MRPLPRMKPGNDVAYVTKRTTCGALRPMTDLSGR